MNWIDELGGFGGAVKMQEVEDECKFMGSTLLGDGSDRGGQDLGRVGDAGYVGMRMLKW